MTVGGWINLIVSVGLVTGLLIFCVWRVLRRPRPDNTLAHVEPIERDRVDGK
jgi:hypothetical protein